MQPAPRDALAFVDYARGQCARYGVRLRLEARGRKGGSTGCVGQFSADDRVLWVAANRSDWLTSLAHELGHLEQWVRRPRPAWFDVDEADFDAWVAGRKRLTRPRSIALTRALQKCELDAEHVAVGHIRHFHLTDDVDDYIRGANLYLMSWEWRRLYGRSVKLGDASEDVDRHVVPRRLVAIRDLGRITPAYEALFLRHQA